MPKPTKVVIIGAGGLAREVAWLLRAPALRGEIEVMGFADVPGGRHLGREFTGLPCRELTHYVSAHPKIAAVVAIGAPKAREKAFLDLDERGISHHTCIDGSAILSPSVRVGAGSVIFGGSTLTVDIVLGRAVILNPGCTVGHDTEIGDFVTITPGVHIAGNVHVERGAFIGIGATIFNGTEDGKLVIGEGATIGAGACVVRDVPAGVTVVGVPATPL